jgi:ElaB/YqjD/DUF883 family membrane-anchored ribosome-binding protein
MSNPEDQINKGIEHRVTTLETTVRSLVEQVKEFIDNSGKRADRFYTDLEKQRDQFNNELQRLSTRIISSRETSTNQLLQVAGIVTIAVGGLWGLAISPIETKMENIDARHVRWESVGGHPVMVQRADTLETELKIENENLRDYVKQIEKRLQQEMVLRDYNTELKLIIRDQGVEPPQQPATTWSTPEPEA